MHVPRSVAGFGEGASIFLKKPSKSNSGMNSKLSKLTSSSLWKLFDKKFSPYDDCEPADCGWAKEQDA